MLSTALGTGISHEQDSESPCSHGNYMQIRTNKVYIDNQVNFREKYVLLRK